MFKRIRLKLIENKIKFNDETIRKFTNKVNNICNRAQLHYLTHTIYNDVVKESASITKTAATTTTTTTPLSTIVTDARIPTRSITAPAVAPVVPLVTPVVAPSVTPAVPAVTPVVPVVAPVVAPAITPAVPAAPVAPAVTPVVAPVAPAVTPVVAPVVAPAIPAPVVAPVVAPVAPVETTGSNLATGAQRQTYVKNGITYSSERYMPGLEIVSIRDALAMPLTEDNFIRWGERVDIALNNTVDGRTYVPSPEDIAKFRTYQRYVAEIPKAKFKNEFSDQTVNTVKFYAPVRILDLFGDRNGTNDDAYEQALLSVINQEQADELRRSRERDAIVNAELDAMDTSSSGSDSDMPDFM